MHSEKVEKFIVFTVAGYHLVLPMGAVLQVVRRPSTTGELEKAGLVQIGRHIIQLLDLQHHLHPDPAHEPERPFLVITHSSLAGLWAIPVNEPPNLVEFPLGLLRSLPQTDRLDDRPDRPLPNILRIASHTATITQNDRTTTVFLMNLKRSLHPITLR